VQRVGRPSRTNHNPIQPASQPWAKIIKLLAGRAGLHAGHQHPAASHGNLPAIIASDSARVSSVVVVLFIVSSPPSAPSAHLFASRLIVSPGISISPAPTSNRTLSYPSLFLFARRPGRSWHWGKSTLIPSTYSLLHILLFPKARPRCRPIYHHAPAYAFYISTTIHISLGQPMIARL
jgi:hypothetical protein